MAAQEQRIDQGEHCGIGPDPQGQDHQHDRGESLVLAQGPDPVRGILPQICQVTCPRHGPLPLVIDGEALGPDAGQVPELAKRFFAGRVGCQPGRDQLPGSHREMELEFGVHLALDPLGADLEPEGPGRTALLAQTGIGAPVRSARLAASTKSCQEELALVNRRRPVRLSR